LLSAFQAQRDTGCAFDTFRSTVVVFPRLAPATADQSIVATHTRLKPTFLSNQLMLGEFYPSCDKPGVHSREFRPLRSPHPLLVIRAMVEADLLFLADRDEFVEAYLHAFGARGVERLIELVETRADRLPPERVEALRRRSARGLRR
jgi:hypothetical protein